MKDKIKKILLLFVFTGTLFVSCTMEEEAIRNHNYSKDIKIYQKSFDELIKDSKFATSFNKLPKRKTNLKSSAQARTVMEEQYGFTITNSPVRVMQVGNSTSYTFHIERNTANSTYFENLVVQNDSIGNTTAHIIKYTPFMPMAPFAEHNSYSFSGNTEFTSIIYDDNYVNGKMVLECRDLYGFRCTGANGYNGSCTASPHIPMGQCTEYTPQCIKYTFITQSCTSYDDGLDDIGTGGGLSSGSGQSGGSGTGGSDPIYSDPLCPTCIELTPELSDFLADLSTEQLVTWNTLDYVVKRSIVSYLVQNSYSVESIQFVNEMMNLETTGNLLSFFPTFKYPVGSNYSTSYPNFTILIKEYIPLLKNDQRLLNTINRLTGVSISAIKNDLTWGNGPEINITQLGLDPTGHPYYGKFNILEPNKIYIDIDLVQQIETLSNIPNPTPQQNQQIGFLNALITFSVCLHEYVHYSDFAFDGTMQDNENLELGLLFEEIYLGGYYEFNPSGNVIFIKAN